VNSQFCTSVYSQYREKVRPEDELLMLSVKVFAYLLIQINVFNRFFLYVCTSVLRLTIFWTIGIKQLTDYYRTILGDGLSS